MGRSAVLLDHSPSSTLPIELWRSIIELLPTNDQRSCLSVCKSLHDIALAFLFSRITIWFGSYQAEWQWSELAVPEEEENDEDRDETTQWRVNVSWEILRRITRDVGFASIVRELSVSAHASGDRIFELRCLMDALDCLPNLRAFRWYGFGPQIQPQVLQALSKACASSLVELSIPLAHGGGPFISALSNLRTLSVEGELAQVFDFSPADLRYESRHYLENAPETLRRIWVHGNGIWDAPVRLFAGLQELFLFMPSTLDGLGLVFHHCTALRSFGLLASYQPCAAQLRTVLETMPTALPQLAALKLILKDSELTSPTTPRALAAFVRNRSALRRLDVHFLSSRNPRCASEFYDVYSTLPNLEVVGIGMQGGQFSSDDLKRLDAQLPLGLTALLIDYACGHAEYRFVRELIDVLRKRTRLRYLHVLDTMLSLDMKQQLLEDHPPELELFGYGPDLRLIESDAETGRPVYSRCWDYAKVQLWTAHYFGCEEWDWLLRYHGFCWGFDHLSPGIIA
ncbi:hypothetical protein BD414DRAFT_481965 [Trametes punicea]|nr:hypothetical protein BD414DRAFT_481965 [Trametes punicea]